MRFLGFCFCGYCVAHFANKPTIKIIDIFCQWANKKSVVDIFFFSLYILYTPRQFTDITMNGRKWKVQYGGISLPYK